MSSLARNKSHSKQSNEIQLESNDKIDQIIKDITLKRPRNPFTQFVLNEVVQLKTKNKNKAIVIKELNAKCAEKWKKLKDSEKKKYIKLFEEEKAKYKADLELVRHYLFKDLNDNSLLHAPTAYRIYLNEKLRDGFEQGLDPKEIQKKASNEWSQMSEVEKKKYLDKKKENDNWFSKAEKINKITPISLFIQKKIEEAKEKHKEPPSLKDIAPAWKKLSKNDKKPYEKYAQTLNEEKRKLQDIYEIVHGIRPRKPAGAFRIFLQEKAKNNEIKSFKDSYEMWNNLSQEEKEEYLTKSHRCILAYRYKKMIYNKKIKKILPKRPRGALQQYLKEKKGQKPANGEKWIVYWRTVYENLPKEKKEKYKEKANKAKEIYDRKMSKFQDKVFDMPKKPISGFSLYVRDRMHDLKKEKPDETTNDLIRQIAKEWQEEKNVDQKLYNKYSEKDKKRFKKQLKEFQKFGYYTKSHGDNSENDEDEDEKKEKDKKKKSNSKACSQKTKKNKNSSSSSKIQKKIRSISKSKKGQKVGKSQRSKK